MLMQPKILRVMCHMKALLTSRQFIPERAFYHNQDKSYKHFSESECQKIKENLKISDCNNPESKWHRKENIIFIKSILKGSDDGV
jgi:hypothetical protein